MVEQYFVETDSEMMRCERDPVANLCQFIRAVEGNTANVYH